MTIIEDRGENKRGWAGKELMYPPPNWYGVSPDIITKRGHPWNQDKTDLPWLDRQDAHVQINARLSDGSLSNDQATWFQQWVDEGYFIQRHAVSPDRFDLLDQVTKDLDDLWTTDEVMDGLQIMSLHIPGKMPAPTSHEELLSWPLERRLELRDTQTWRIHYYSPYSKAAQALTWGDKIVETCDLIFGEEASNINCIGFKYGSEVTLHCDLDAYHIHPANRLIGIWLALEDIQPEAGPLAVYPGSHKIPQWPGWNNYPQTCLRTSHVETRDRQAAFLKEAAKDMERRPLPINKGDAIYQHPLQVHGADKRVDRTLTRRSLVMHFSVRDGDKMHEVEGPFNW